MTELSRKLKRLNRAARALTTVSDREQLLESILNGVQKVFQRQTAAVLLKQDHTLSIAAARGYDPEVVASFKAQLGSGVAGMVASTGKPRLVVDVQRESAYIEGVSCAKSEMAVPLIIDGEVIGVLDVESREAAFGEEDMALLEAFGEQAAWALRYGQTLAQASERARRLELLNRAARALNTVHDPDELLTTILELSHKALGFRHVAILVADETGQHLVVKKALRRQGIEDKRISVKDGVTGAVFSSGIAEIVDNIATDPRYINGGMGAPRNARAEMVAPLALNGDIIGVLDAEGDQGSFGPLDLEVFSAFAAQVATALRNAQWMRSLENRARRLDQIARTGRALNTILNADELLQEILVCATTALELEQAAILLFEPDSQQLVVYAAQGYGDICGRRIPVGQGVTGTVAATGKPLLVRNVRADPRYVPGICKGACEMAAPLRAHGEVLGVLDTESDEAYAFSERDLELLEVFADQAAVALNNARLFRRLEAANRSLKKSIEEMERLDRDLEAYAQQIAETNEHLAFQVRQLTTLHQAGQTITSSLDLKETLSAILRMSAEIVTSSAGAIKLLDEETKELSVAAQAGIFEQGDVTVTTYDVPLKIGERTIGVFELVRQANDELNSGERQMLETLAAQAAIAIENARLFEDTQKLYYETLRSLAKALETRDHYTRGHSERVADLAVSIARALGCDDEDCHLIFNSALLHDIGKIGVRDAVLHAPRQLSEQELGAIRQHPSFGNMILGPLKFLGQVAELVKHHHERWDGTGYPDGLKATDIPLASRIIAVADTYDAMTSDRPYRAARQHREAVEEIEGLAGNQLDPDVVRVFLQVVPRWLATRKTA